MQSDNIEQKDFFPATFLPMIITSESEKVMSGKITFTPALKENQIKEIEEDILKHYPGRDILKDGYCVNFADLSTIMFFAIPLIYENFEFQIPDKRIAELGDTAVIITNPGEFAQRLRNAVDRIFPNFRYLEIASINYRNCLDKNSEQWDLYTKPEKDDWKKELAFAARVKPSLRIGGQVNIPTEVIFDIGNLSDIAVPVKTSDLLNGIPNELNQLKPLMDRYVPVLSGIQNSSFSVMGNFMSIEPISKWIDVFYDILGNDWKANTILERLYVDGASMPRLVFYKESEKIYFGINCLQFQINSWEEKNKSIVSKIINEVGKYIPGFCRMSVATNANIGSVKEKEAERDESVHEERMRNYKGLILTESIETDYMVSPNMLGIFNSQRAWHYVISTSLPSNENTMWYSADNVIDFFDEAEEFNISRIQELLKGDGYVRYHNI